ncbi:MAG TPA: NUDIX domain-containing protein [Patescibacteria group bacterium]|nr:NUDIX domain-containing protein [Patescibacteria group bacterium]
METLKLSDHVLKIYSLIYLFNEGRVLLIHRDQSKTDMAGKLTGLGGRIEQGESLIDSAKREFLEESGLHLTDAMLRGTFQWFDESRKICMTHIIFAHAFLGELKESNREGVLSWHTVNELDKLANLAQYQRMFLSYLLADENRYYCGIGQFENEELVDYVDTVGGKLE